MPCTSWAAGPSHAGCVRLRAIPFRGSTRADRRYRELFVKRYFWGLDVPGVRAAAGRRLRAARCRRRPAARPAPLAARVAELEKRARLTDVPREARRRAARSRAPDRRAREGERPPARRRWSAGQATSTALQGEGGLAVGSVRGGRDRRPRQWRFGTSW